MGTRKKEGREKCPVFWKRRSCFLNRLLTLQTLSPYHLPYMHGLRKMRGWQNGDLLDSCLKIPLPTSGQSWNSESLNNHPFCSSRTQWPGSCGLVNWIEIRGEGQVTCDTHGDPQRLSRENSGIPQTYINISHSLSSTDGHYDRWHQKTRGAWLPSLWQGPEDSKVRSAGVGRGRAVREDRGVCRSRERPEAGSWSHPSSKIQHSDFSQFLFFCSSPFCFPTKQLADKKPSFHLHILYSVQWRARQIAEEKNWMNSTFKIYFIWNIITFFSLPFPPANTFLVPVSLPLKLMVPFSLLWLHTYTNI